MRKVLLLSLTFSVVLAALILAPLSGAKKNVASNNRVLPDKLTQAKQSSAAQVVKAVSFGESKPVRDLPRTRVKNPSPGVKDREEMLEEKREKNAENSLTTKGVEDFDLFEKNETNREIIRHVDIEAPSTADQALSSNNSRSKRPTPNPPNPPSVNFEGQSIADTIAVGQGFLPPDTNGDVGPAHYVQTVNVTFRIWDKAGSREGEGFHLPPVWSA